MKSLSLKFRFAIVMSIGALALVFGMGAISLHYAQRDLLSTVSSQQLALVTRTADAFDSRLRLAIDSLAAFASAVPRDIIVSDARFDGFFAANPALLQMFDDLLVLDPAGVVAADYPSRQHRIGLDLSDRSFFQRAMASGKPVISEPALGKVSGKPIVAFAVPIVDGDGKVLALMVGLLRLDKNNLLGELSSARFGEKGYFTVVATGAEPLFLAHPDAARLMHPVPRTSGRVLAQVVGATTPGDVTGVLHDGSEALVSYRPLTMTPWIIAAILPRAEAFAAIDGARDRTLLVAVGAALVVLPLVWLFAWRLLLPLSALRAQVEAIAADPSTKATATVGSDEVGQVALAFNAMLLGQRRSDTLRIASDQDRRRLVAILESSRDFVAMTDPGGHVTYMNAAGRLVCGAGLDDDLRHTTIQDYFAPWAVRRLLEEGVPSALSDGIWLGETAVIAEGGREIPVDHTMVAHRNVDGAVEFFSSLLHDISAAKASSAAMRASEARMLSIADALPVLVAFIDCDYRYVFVNSRYEDHFGMNRTAMIGKSIVELIGQAAFERYLPYLQQAARGETQVFDIESRVGLLPADFLVKLIPEIDDGQRLIGYHFIHQDVTDHKAEHQRLSRLVHADALTGLLNRAGFEVAIDDAMLRSRNHASVMALFYLDVDRFKSINDQHGHLVGDALLRAFADRLVRALRSADVAARLGGDEFVVIAEGLREPGDVRAIAGKILGAMRPGFEVEGITLSITTSVGIAAYHGEPIGADELIGRADAALYRAKHAGRDRYDLDESARTTAGAAGDPDPALELSLLP